jgi:hypothetical protein
MGMEGLDWGLTEPDRNLPGGRPGSKVFGIVDILFRDDDSLFPVRVLFDI